jgi:hypothetical protein
MRYDHKKGEGNGRLVALDTALDDIHFRVVQTGTSHVVLHSDCYRLVVRD